MAHSNNATWKMHIYKYRSGVHHQRFFNGERPEAVEHFKATDIYKKYCNEPGFIISISCPESILIRNKPSKQDLEKWKNE